MLAEITAILSAMGWAGDSVLVRLGARKSNVYTAMLVSYTVSVTCIWIYLLSATSLEFLSSPAILYYLASGCLQPLLARALYYVALTRIGVSRAGPLRGAEPLFAVAIAVSFLGERPALPVYVGTVLIVASIWVISWKRAEDSNWQLLYAVFPLGAALASAISQSLRKQGLTILPNPFVPVAVTTTTSLTLLVIFLLAARKASALRVDRQSLRFYLPAALLATVAQVLNFVALGRGEMSVIIPLLNTTPLFTVFFSSLFLKEVEKVTARIVLGAILMVAGVVAITSR